MKSMVICHPNIVKSHPDEFYSNWVLNKQQYNIGLLEIPAKPFPVSDIHQECILVKKLAFSCNYRDKVMIHMMYDSCLEKSNITSYFFAPFGSEFCAEVIKVGGKVSRIKPGDRVIPDGSYPIKEDQVRGGLPSNYASQRYEILHEHQVMRIPEDMDTLQASAFTIGAQTVYSMIRKLDIKPGGKVLVMSATSNTSLIAIKALKRKFVTVYAMTTQTDREEELKSLGIHKVLPSVLTADEELIKSMREEKYFFDYVIDPFFDLHLHKILPFMNFNSSYITCGFYNQHESSHNVTNGNIEYLPILQTIMLKNISIIGNCLGEKSDLENALIDHGKGKFDIPIDSVYSGDQINEFLNRTFHSRERMGKVVYQYET